MSDDVGRGPLGGTGAPGEVVPADPTGTPGRAPVSAPEPTGPVSGRPAPARHSRTGVLWTGLILSALVLLFLLVFIIQNDQPVLISFFALEGVLPSGVALLLAAIAGILLGAIPGTLRIMQLRRAARRGPR